MQPSTAICQTLFLSAVVTGVSSYKTFKSTDFCKISGKLYIEVWVFKIEQYVPQDILQLMIKSLFDWISHH